MTTTTPLPVQPAIPDGAFAGDVPLVGVMRGDWIGSLHRGSAVVVDLDGNIVVSVGDPELEAFLRSAAKPFQVMPAILSGGVDRFGLTERELAVLCASHHAEAIHMQTVRAVLDKLDLPESALRCGIHPPIDEASAAEIARSGAPPTPVWNNCSGAHTGMLVACRAMDWPIDNYGDPDHPLQVWIREALGSFSGIAPGALQYAVDNCAVPTFRMPLSRAALAFARLAAASGVSDDLAKAARRVVHAMTTYPEMIGGNGSFDTDLMGVTHGTVVCKGGAEGFQGAGGVGSGLGMAIKISDGNSRAIPPVALALLESVGVVDAQSAEALASHTKEEAFNFNGQRVGGMVRLFTIGNDA